MMPEVYLFSTTEPVWCVYCARQAHYDVDGKDVCGRHLLKAVRAARAPQGEAGRE